MDSRTSKGPTDARSKLSLLLERCYRSGQLNSNDFVMQIDSHMDFVDSFDVELVKMHARAENDYAVLSTCVPPRPRERAKRAQTGASGSSAASTSFVLASSKEN